MIQLVFLFSFFKAMKYNFHILILRDLYFNFKMCGMWNFLQKQDLKSLSCFAKQIRQLNILNHLLMFIIIHLKYFSVSDWLKEYA